MPFLYLIIELGVIGASRKLHLNLLERVLQLPMHFFDSTPVGRIINRFSKDIDTIDEDVGFDLFEDVFECFFESVAIIMVVSYTSPYFLTVFPELLVIYILIQVNFKKELCVSCICVSANILRRVW